MSCEGRVHRHYGNLEEGQSGSPGGYKEDEKEEVLKWSLEDPAGFYQGSWEVMAVSAHHHQGKGTRKHMVYLQDGK